MPGAADGNTFFTVALTGPQARSYEAQLNSTGRYCSIRRGNAVQPVGGTFPLKPLANPARESMVRGWLTSIGTKEPTRLGSLTVDRKGTGFAHFPILRNGYPFVAYQHFGYEFAFVAATGEFLSFKASQNPPPIAPGQPKVDKNGALAAVKHVWDTEITPRAINQYHWRRVWYTLNGEPELGYFLPEGQTSAILVWWVRYYSHRDVGDAIQGGTNGMLIEAVTGRQVKTRYVPG